MADRTLRDLILAHEPLLRRTLSAIWVEDTAAGRTATLSYVCYGPIGTGRGCYATVDDAALPDGVTLGGVERWPDSRYVIDGGGTPDDAIRALDADRLVGALDWTRIGSRWIVKTHAGSQRERTAWLLSLTRSRP